MSDIFAPAPPAELPKLPTLDAIYAKRDWWQNRLVNARNRRDAAEKTIRQCHQHTGWVTVAQQIAEAMQPHFPDHRLSVVGPFGLGRSVSIRAFSQGFDTIMGSLAFRPVGDFLGLIDYDVNTMEYPPNSIGHVNGFNHPTTDIPRGSIESLVALLHTRIEETRADLNKRYGIES